MLRREGDFSPETPRQRRPPELNIGCNRELNRLRSDASSLTAEDCKAFIRSSADATPDDSTAWTDEKHNLYLHDLEVSFVKQLHYSMAFLANSLKQNQRDVNISQKQLSGVKNAFEQFKVLQNGCSRKINYVDREPISGSSSADLCTPLKSTRVVYNYKCMGSNCSLPSAEKAGSREVWSAMKHLKGTISHRLMAFSQEYSSTDSYLGDLFDLQREGTGQNFPDEGTQITSKSEPWAKRPKTAVADSSQDQIIRSLKRLPTTDNHVIGRSNLGQ